MLLSRTMIHRSNRHKQMHAPPEITSNSNRRTQDNLLKTMLAQKKNETIHDWKLNMKNVKKFYINHRNQSCNLIQINNTFKISSSVRMYTRTFKASPFSWRGQSLMLFYTC